VFNELGYAVHKTVENSSDFLPKECTNYCQQRHAGSKT